MRIALIKMSLCSAAQRLLLKIYKGLSVDDVEQSAYVNIKNLTAWSSYVFFSVANDNLSFWNAEIKRLMN